jgi:hypothetical protein
MHQPTRLARKSCAMPRHGALLQASSLKACAVGCTELFPGGVQVGWRASSSFRLTGVVGAAPTGQTQKLIHVSCYLGQVRGLPFRFFSATLFFTTSAAVPLLSLTDVGLLDNYPSTSPGARRRRSVPDLHVKPLAVPIVLEVMSANQRHQRSSDPQPPDFRSIESVPGTNRLEIAVMTISRLLQLLFPLASIECSALG